MKRFFYLYIIFAFFAGCTEDNYDGHDRGTIWGNVRMALTNEPLENVKITTTPSTRTVYSTEDGRFEILESIPMGDYTVKAELSGYVTEVKAVTIKQLDQIVTIDFEMVTDESLNQPPSIPQLLSPENMATGLPNDVLLKWESTDPDQDTLTYDVRISNNTTNTELEFTELVNDTLQLNDLHFGTTYTWQVGVSDGINEMVYSQSSQFTIRENPEYRYHFVRLKEGNFVIYASNLEETFAITAPAQSSWRPHKNNTANKLAFLQTLAGQIQLVTSDLNGENQKTISQVPITGFRSQYLDFDWNQAGNQILFPSLDKLYRVNHDGTGQTQIYQTADGSFITKVSWSYDGSKIALVTNDNSGYNAKIIIIDSQGNFIDTIFENEQGAVGGLDWNITGDKLLYTHDVSGFQNWEYRQLDTHIFIYDFNDGSSLDISLESEKPDGTLDLDPQFAPNDAGILFTNTSNDLISVKNVYFIDLNEPEDRELVIENAEMPDFR